MTDQKPTCPKCRHFYITWDARFPNGCRAYGIKAKYPPALEVFRATGKSCLLFERKVQR